MYKMRTAVEFHSVLCEPKVKKKNISAVCNRDSHSACDVYLDKSKSESNYRET